MWEHLRISDRIFYQMIFNIKFQNNLTTYFDRKVFSMENVRGPLHFIQNALSFYAVNRQHKEIYSQIRSYFMIKVWYTSTYKSNERSASLMYPLCIFGMRNSYFKLCISYAILSFYGFVENRLPHTLKHI